MSVHVCTDHPHKEGLFERFISPWLVHGACSLPPISQQRKQIVPQAEGLVVELGMGSGLNMPFYDADKVQKLIGIDPGAALMKQGARSRRKDAL